MEVIHAIRGKVSNDFISVKISGVDQQCRVALGEAG
jgi:hypothetical protein